jgi:hypothetical protein
MPKYLIITQSDIDDAHIKHKLWLANAVNGERAVFDSCSIDNVNMNGYTFSGASFRLASIGNSCMIGADFQNTNFAYVKFYNVAASGTSFNNCNFSHSTFLSTNLADSDFKNVNFYNTDIRSVNISYANFQDANLIIGGYDSRGYLFYAYRRPDGGITIRAGCRTFHSLSDAYSHWHTRHQGNIVLSEEIMGNLDKIKKVAKAKGWIE